MHQAGSDSLLTEQVFLKMADVSFNGLENLDNTKYRGHLYGYGGNQALFRRGTQKNNQAVGAGANGAVGGGGVVGNGVAAANGNGNGGGNITGEPDPGDNEKDLTGVSEPSGEGEAVTEALLNRNLAGRGEAGGEATDEGGVEGGSSGRVGEDDDDVGSDSVGTPSVGTTPSVGVAEDVRGDGAGGAGEGEGEEDSGVQF
ncbi:unnamed protein product [Choristocarpus tenellus]